MLKQQSIPVGNIDTIAIAIDKQKVRTTFERHVMQQHEKLVTNNFPLLHPRRKPRIFNFSCSISILEGFVDWSGKRFLKYYLLLLINFPKKPEVYVKI